MSGMRLDVGKRKTKRDQRKRREIDRKVEKREKKRGNAAVVSRD